MSNSFVFLEGVTSPFAELLEKMRLLPSLKEVNGCVDRLSCQKWDWGSLHAVCFQGWESLFVAYFQDWEKAVYACNQGSETMASAVLESQELRLKSFVAYDCRVMGRHPWVF